jgi:hypothetical protein
MDRALSRKCNLCALDLESIIKTLMLRVLTELRWRLPITVATVSKNGGVIFTRVTDAPAGSPPGSVAIEHVTGEVGDEGFEAPLHLMLTDATGRVRLAIARGSGPPALLAVVEEDE